MHSSKTKGSFQQHQFKVIVETDLELVYSFGKDDTLFAFDAWVCDGPLSETSCAVYVDTPLWNKRRELFRAGHRLVIVAWTDGFAPILYADDAWFDRHRPG